MAQLLLVPLDDTVVFPTMDVTLPIDVGDATRVLLIPRHGGEFARVGTVNLVIMLDEVDKVGADWRGDPSAALLEVLDPAQNHSFRNHYLDVELDLAVVRDALGRQRFFQEAAERTAVPGVATGLSVTGTGGDVLFIEATAMKGKEPLVLTGQLGDVMKESARIALSWVRSHASELDIDDSAFDERSFHVHVPAGAIPKDGPSAGITMTTALASLLTGRPVKHTVGLTGEVTLQGRVLPIGGLKQKVLAAHAAGLAEGVNPERNRGDLEEVPEEVREQMTFHPVMSIDEVLDLALEPAAPEANVGIGHNGHGPDVAAVS